MSIQITDVTGGFRPIRISIYILPCFSVLIRNISGPSYGTIPASPVGLSTLHTTTVSTGVCIWAGADRAGASDSDGIQVGTILGTEVGTIPGIAPGTVVTIRDGVIHTGITHIGDIPVGIIRTGAVEAVIIPTGPTGLIGQDNGLDSEAE